MTLASTRTRTARFPSNRMGEVLPFESIDGPGCYVCAWSGHLLRVPEDGIAPGRSPRINLVARRPLMVTRISEDPYIPVTRARLLAANLDIGVGF